MKGLQRGILAVFFILLAGIIPLAAFYIYTPGGENVLFGQESPADFSREWTVDYREDRRFTVTKTLPVSLPDQAALCVAVNCVAVEVDVSGERVYTYGRHPDNPFGIPFGRVWLLVDLPAGAQGKEVSLTFSSSRYDVEPERLQEVFIGQRSDLLFYLFRQNIPVGIFSMGCLAIGLLFAGISAVLAVRRRNWSSYFGFFMLGIFSLLSGAWVLTDSGLMQFLAGDTEAVFMVSFLLFMLLPPALLIFIRTLRVMPHLIIDVLCIIYLLNAAICMALHLLGLVPLTSNILVMHILLAAGVLILFALSVWELTVRHNRRVREVLVGMLFLLVFALLALVRYYLSSDSGYSMLFQVGLLCFITCLSMAAAAARRALEAAGESAKTELYRRLAYLDLMTGLRNRTAFEADMKKLETSHHREGLGFIIFDINDLKEVNDTLGHAEGDRLIIRAGAGVKKYFGKLGVCYRMGGDEFVVCIDRADERRVQEALRGLEEWLEQENRTDPMMLRMAWGYAIRRDERQSAQAVLNRADREMYAHKQRIKNMGVLEQS